MIIVPGKGSCRILSWKNCPWRRRGKKKSAKVGGSSSVLAEKFRNIVMNGLSLEGRRMKMAQTLRQSTRQWLPNSSTWGNPAPRLRGFFPYSTISRSFFQPGSRPKVPGLQLLQLRPSTFSLHLQRFPTIQLFCCSLNNPDSIPNPHDVFYPQPSKTLCRKGNLQLGGRLPGRVPRESHDVTPPVPPPPLHLSSYYCC